MSEVGLSGMKWHEVGKGRSLVKESGVKER